MVFRMSLQAIKLHHLIKSHCLHGIMSFLKTNEINMNIIRFILFFLAIFGVDQLYTQTCLSPDGQKSISFSLSSDGQPQYEMKLGETTVIRTSRLGLELKNDTDLMSDFAIEDVQYESFDNTWTPVWGEESQIRNHYNEMFISLNQKTTDRTMNIRFRVYNEGMGFRYEFPQQPNLGHFIVSQEKTQFSLTGNHTAFWIPGD